MTSKRKTDHVAVAVTRLQWAIDHKETPDGAGVARCTADLIRAVVRDEMGAGNGRE